MYDVGTYYEWNNWHFEVEAMYKAALAAERAAYEQYQMAVDGAQTEDKASAASMVDAARSTVDEVSALLVDARLTAPEDGQIATIFPKRGELVAPGTPIMNLVVMNDVHVVLNVREDLMPQFKWVKRLLQMYLLSIKRI